MGEYVLAADLGGTNLRMSVVGRLGQIANSEKRRTPHDKDAEVIVAAIAELAERCSRSVVIEGSITTLAIAAPVIMNIKDGTVGKSPNIPSLNGFDLKRSLKDKTGLGVVLENDATAAAIGEHWLGAARGNDNCICVTLGTGVGGGLILKGEAFRGPDGTAGEIGHVCVEPNGHPCGCGSWGCLEQYSSAAAVVRMAKEFAEKSGSVLSGIDNLTAKDVFNAAIKGDPAALEAYRSMGYYLGLALAGSINVFDPEIIVLAGGMSAAWDAFIAETRDQIAKRAFREPADRVKLVRAELGDNAGTLGVAHSAFTSREQGHQGT